MPAEGACVVHFSKRLEINCIVWGLGFGILIKSHLNSRHVANMNNEQYVRIAQRQPSVHPSNSMRWRDAHFLHFFKSSLHIFRSHFFKSSLDSFLENFLKNSKFKIRRSPPHSPRFLTKPLRRQRRSPRIPHSSPSCILSLSPHAPPAPFNVYITSSRPLFRR